MDNLTHSLTGVLLARAGLDRLSPRATCGSRFWRRTFQTLTRSALLGGSDVYFMHHRWATHALLFAPLVAILPVLASGCDLPAGLALVSSMADLPCGVGEPSAARLHEPIWNPPVVCRFPTLGRRLNFTHVIDIWIWAILLIGCLWPMLSGLVGSEIGAKGDRAGRGMAIAALCRLLSMTRAATSCIGARSRHWRVARVRWGGAQADVAFPAKRKSDALGLAGWRRRRSWQEGERRICRRSSIRSRVERFWKTGAESRDRGRAQPAGVSGHGEVRANTAMACDSRRGTARTRTRSN